MPHILLRPKIISVAQESFVDRFLRAHRVFRSAFGGKGGVGLGFQPRVKAGPFKAKFGPKAVVRGEFDLSPNLLGRIQSDATLFEISAFNRAKLGLSSDQFNLVIDDGQSTRFFEPGVLGAAITPTSNIEVKPFEISIGGTFFVLDGELSIDFERIFDSNRILFTGQ